MASKVEDALAKALPLAISFLASLIGLGGISEKIRSIIETVQRPINKAVDAIVLKAVKAFKKPMDWAKGKYAKAKQLGDRTSSTPARSGSRGSIRASAAAARRARPPRKRTLGGRSSPRMPLGRRRSRKGRRRSARSGRSSSRSRCAVPATR